MIFSLFLTLLLWFSPDNPTPQKELRILFVGNSLTYVNDVPALVAEIGKMDKVAIKYKQLAHPDYSLADHLAQNMVQDEILKGKYDFVVVQQGPSAMQDSRRILLRDAAKFKELCDLANSKLCFYMVWPSKARLFDLENVITSYTLAATETQSLVARAGLAWKYAWEADGSMDLYGPDNFHPSYSGSLLAAMAIYGGLTLKHQLEFVDYKKLSPPEDMSREKFDALKAAAVKALNQ